MFLYRTQPKTTDTNNIINLHSKETMLRGIRDVTPTFGGKSPHRNDFITLFTDGCVLDGMLTLAGYDNILVVTSFEDNNYERLRDRNYRPVNSAGDHMLPIIHKLNGSHGNIYVTKVLNGDSFYSKLYDQYDIKTVDSNSYFKIDGDLKLKTDVKFDAVVLLGCESYKTGKFSIKEIKAKFAKYCVEDFDLIDVYRGDRRIITGGTKSIDTIKSKMIETVNTPTIIYDFNTRLNESKDWSHMREKLQYFRLVLNFEHMNKYYKVY